jgi:U2-associated protein SR140
MFPTTNYDEDAISTNLFITGLAPTVTELDIQTLCSPYGPIESIKILWPRTEEEKTRKRNCGFVNFFHRADAQEAMVKQYTYYITFILHGTVCRIN